MTKYIALALGLSAMAATAFASDLAQLDTNADGVLSLEEVQAAFADVTAEQFAAADSNADGSLDADELAAAQEAGTIPAAIDG